jgi:uncharacterized protein (DUF58 family)
MTGRPGVDLLEPGLLARLERLQLVTRRRLAGTLMGEHRSPRRGPSLDFADFRDYHAGDDLRRLDVAAMARLDRLLLRLYEAEDDLVVRLLVDTSASMAGEKLERARQLAAALGFVALVRRDEVTVQTFPGGGQLRRFRGRAAAADLFEHLAGLGAAGTSGLTEAADRLVGQGGPGGLTVVISDLLTPEWDDGLRRLPVRGADLAVVQLLHPTDLDPALEGDLELVDAETGELVEVSVSAAVLEEYRAAAAAWVDDVAARVRSRGGVHLQTSSSEPVESILLRHGREAGVLR